jgi:transposase
MAAPRTVYPSECQPEAVRLIPEQRSGVAETARHFGIHGTPRRRWQQESPPTAAAAFPGSGRLTPKPEALRWLREENTRRKMARAIVKKPGASVSTHRSARRRYGGASGPWAGGGPLCGVCGESERVLCVSAAPCRPPSRSRGPGGERPRASDGGAGGAALGLSSHGHTTPGCGL